MVTRDSCFSRSYSYFTVYAWTAASAVYAEVKYWLHLLYLQGQLRQIVYAEVLQRRQLRHLWLQLLYLLY